MLWPNVLLFSPIESYRINVLGPMSFIIFQWRSTVYTTKRNIPKRKKIEEKKVVLTASRNRPYGALVGPREIALYQLSSRVVSWFTIHTEGGGLWDLSRNLIAALVRPYTLDFHLYDVYSEIARHICLITMSHFPPLSSSTSGSQEGTQRHTRSMW